MRTSATIGACLALLLAGSTVARAQNQESGWIDFETIDQSALPIVGVRLNGAGPYRLVLDVGFEDFVLDTTIVEGSGLKLASRGETATIDFYGRKEKVPVAVLQELRVGEVSFPLVRTLLIEGEDGTGIGGLRSYGRIGRDLLERLRLTVHYPRRLLHLEPSPEGAAPEGGASFRSAGRFLVVPVAVSRGDAVEEVPMVLDAGTSGTVLDRKWGSDFGVAPRGAVSARIPSLRIGGFEAREFPVLLGVMKELPFNTDAFGVIGADLLLGLSVTFDFARDLVWLVPVLEEAP